MKKNGFTLIELLVVVAIIGILAAVGTVAYNGYTKSAKIVVVKANHKRVVDYMRSEVMRCELGLVVYGMEGKLSCKSIDASYVARKIISNSGVLRDKISNPYGCNAYCQSLGYGGKYNTLSYGDASKKFNIQNQLGVIFLQAVDDNGNDAFSNSTATGIKVTSCNKLPCDPTTGEGYMKTTFAVDEF